jgi:hypothetical protein
MLIRLPPPAAGASATRPTWCTVHACGARPLPLLILRAPLAPTVRLRSARARSCHSHPSSLTLTRTRRERTSLSVPHRAPPDALCTYGWRLALGMRRAWREEVKTTVASTGRVPPASTDSFDDARVVCVCRSKYSGTPPYLSSSRLLFLPYSLAHLALRQAQEYL